MFNFLYASETSPCCSNFACTEAFWGVIGSRVCGCGCVCVFVGVFLCVREVRMGMFGCGVCSCIMNPVRFITDK